MNECYKCENRSAKVKIKIISHLNFRISTFIHSFIRSKFNH